MLWLFVLFPLFGRDFIHVCFPTEGMHYQKYSCLFWQLRVDVYEESDYITSHKYLLIPQNQRCSYFNIARETS